MNAVLTAWDEAETEAAMAALLSCCAARRWAAEVTSMRPFEDVQALYDAANTVWAEMGEADWMEAFRAHPRIGDRRPAHASAQSSAWSRQEQALTEAAAQRVIDELAAGNARYEELFGFTYIVCATGKSAEEMLEILQRRLTSDRETELREAAEQQRLITQIRLRKWLEA